MKSLFLFLALAFLSTFDAFAQSEFELKASQSMLMTGKGAGQDGAINPFYGQDCYAMVENLGDSGFSIRIQQAGEIIEIIPVYSREVKKVRLYKGYELYLDANPKEKIRLRLDFEKIDD